MAEWNMEPGLPTAVKRSTLDHTLKEKDILFVLVF